MIKRLTLLVALFTMSLSAPVLAAEPANGIIEGQIVNGTVGGSSVADQDITLSIYRDEVKIDTATAKTDTDGRFVFNELSTAPAYKYEVVLKFQGVDYNSERLNFNEGETTKSTEIIVYDATTSDKAIKISMSHIIIYVEENGLLVKEYYLLTNMSDRTYIGSANGENTEVLRFPLPQGANGLQPTIGLMDCCIISSEGGFADTMPVPPGMKEMAYSYIIEHDSGTYTFPKVINYPTNRFDLLVQGKGVEVTSDQLAIDAPMNIEGIQFNHLSGQEFTKGENLVIRISGLPRTHTQGSIIWMLLALVVIAAGFVLVYLMKRKRLQPESDGGALRQQQRLLAELAELDDNFEDGRIPEETYRRLRDEKKAELIDIMQRQKGE